MRRNKFLLSTLILGLALLALAGFVLVGAYLNLSRGSSAPIVWANPIQAVNPVAIAPDLAVRTLAGESDDRVIRASLDSGEPDTAYATLAYSLALPDTQRGGNWLLCARTYQDVDPARALLANGVLLDHAALGGTLSDLARGELALGAAQGLTALNRPAVARLAVAETEKLAQQSTTLLPAQRRALFEKVIAAYRAIGDESVAAGIQKSLDRLAAGPGVAPEPDGQLLPELLGTVTLPQDVISTLAARQKAAAFFSARWITTEASARQPLVDALAEALRAEDAARSQFYESLASLSAPDQLALMHDRVAWRSIKWRVAGRGFGLSLVPEWEGQLDVIRVELAAAYTDLINAYGRQLDGLAAADAVAGRVELLRQGVLWSRLGLFPGGAEQVLAQQLVDASQKLWTRRGGTGLVIVTHEVQGARFYLLTGAATAASAGTGSGGLASRGSQPDKLTLTTPYGGVILHGQVVSNLMSE